MSSENEDTQESSSSHSGCSESSPASSSEDDGLRIPTPAEREQGRAMAAIGYKEHGLIPKIENVVATCNLGVELDLKNITQRARNAEYNPKRFGAVIMRIRDPKTTALIFGSGKIVVTGAKSEERAQFASRKFAKIIYKMGYSEARWLDFTIQNMVGVVDVPFGIHLERLVSEHHQFARYEPEIFPGLTYEMKLPKLVMLIFMTGKVVFTGSKTRADIETAFDKIYPVIAKHAEAKQERQKRKKGETPRKRKKSPKKAARPSKKARSTKQSPES